MKLKILYILMQRSKRFIFCNIFLHWKVIISFLELFSATCFLCILQTQLTKRNTSIPKKLKKRKHMTLMMTLSNDDKSDIYQFFLSRFIPYCQYRICTKFHVKWTKIFWDTASFFTAGLLGPPWDFKKSPYQIGLTLNKLLRKPVFTHVFTKLQGKMERNFYQ